MDDGQGNLAKMWADRSQSSILSPGIPDMASEWAASDPLPNPYVQPGEEEEDAESAVEEREQPGEDSEAEVGRVDTPAASQAGRLAERRTLPIQSPRPGLETPKTGSSHASQLMSAVSLDRLDSKIVTVTGLERQDRVLIIKFVVDSDRWGRSVQHNILYDSVSRKRTEFEDLFYCLVDQNPQVLVPEVPPVVTSAGEGTEQDGERLQAAFERWLNIVFSHPVLGRSGELDGFAGPVREYRPSEEMPSRQVPSKGVVMEGKAKVIQRFQTECYNVQKSMESIQAKRKELGKREMRASDIVNVIYRMEQNHLLRTAFSNLSSALLRVSDRRTIMATFEATHLGDALSYHQRDAGNVVGAHYIKQLLEKKFAETKTEEAKRANYALMIAEGVDVGTAAAKDAVAQVEHARSEERRINHQLVEVTRGLDRDTAVWLKRTSREVMGAIQEYADVHIQNERRILQLFAAVQPSVENVMGKSGLAYLGRESGQVQVRTQHPVERDWTSVPGLAEDRADKFFGSAFAAPGVGTGKSVEEPSMGNIETFLARNRHPQARVGVEEHPRDRLDRRLASRVLGMRP